VTCRRRQGLCLCWLPQYQGQRALAGVPVLVPVPVLVLGGSGTMPHSLYLGIPSIDPSLYLVKGSQ
jgi:hypothetical protein